MSGAINRHMPVLAHGQESVTGSKVITARSIGANAIEKVTLVQNLNGAAVKATEANKAARLTVEIAADKKSFTIYAWKVTASGDNTLVAATSAVMVDYIAVVE